MPHGSLDLRRSATPLRAANLSACLLVLMALAPRRSPAIGGTDRMMPWVVQGTDGAVPHSQDAADADATCETFRCRLTAALKSEECADKRIPRSIRKQFKGTIVLVERALAKPEESRQRERLANRARILLGHAQIRTFLAQKFASRWADGGCAESLLDAMDFGFIGSI